MLKSGQLLVTPFEFDNAKFFGLDVIVFQHGEIIDYGGKIENHYEDAVYINDGYYLKAVCQFKVR